jgi:hypothetical protein
MFLNVSIKKNVQFFIIKIVFIELNPWLRFITNLFLTCFNLISDSFKNNAFSKNKEYYVDAVDFTFFGNKIQLISKL